MTDPSGLAGIVVATIGGLAIGVERQRTGHATGRHARFGGVRTFTLLGGVAGLAGWLTTLHFIALGVVLIAGAIALVISGYVAASHREVDATTEAAALVAIAAGLVSGIGSLALGSGIIAVTVLLLVEKSRLHALVGRLADEELRAAARFGVMAVVVLPLLPEGPYGPLGGVRPRGLWLLVLFFTGLSFVGYLLRRLFGAGRGYPIAGLLGGLVSSTNVTFSYARLSRHERGLAQPLAIGAIAACTMLFPRVMIAAAVLNLTVARMLLPYLAAPFLVGVACLVLWWRRRGGSGTKSEQPSNPLQVIPALQMAMIFQIVLFTVAGISRAFNGGGLRLAGAVLGLTDVDALTVAMTTTAVSSNAAEAAAAIAIGILANCVMKALLAIGLGARDFSRLTAAVLTVMAAAIVTTIVLLR